METEKVEGLLDYDDDASNTETSEDEDEVLGPPEERDAMSDEDQETAMEVDRKRKGDEDAELDQADSKRQKLEDPLPEGTTPLRGYQKEISRNILEGKNDIIILPTGTGKTAVAANLILQHLHLYKKQRKLAKAKVLFLVPRVVLVDQQLKVIRDYMGQSWSRYCRRLSGGDIDSMERLKYLFKEETESLVIVATPGSVFNYFKAYQCSTMRDFSLIIFDECHNAKGQDPYNRLLQRYLLDSQREDNSKGSLPQLVGLTATIGIGDSKKKPDAINFILDACAKLGLDSVPTEVEQFKEELEGLIDPPYKDTREVASARKDEFSLYLRDIMKGIVKDLTAKLKENPVTKQLSKKFKPKSDVMDLSLLQQIRTVQSELDNCKCDGDLSSDLNSICEYLKIFQGALVRANLATCKGAMDYIKQCMSSEEMQTAHPLQKRYQDEWLACLETKSTNETINEKLGTLKSELDKVLKSDRMDDDSIPRVMVFVEHRYLAATISDWLNSQGYKSERFVSSQVSAEKDGMSKAEAEFVMDQFREGELNILVATSVLSEGVDVPECNAVIRYMYIKDVIAEVQVPGRVRSKNGRVVAIFDDKLKKQYLDNRFREKIMKEALEQIRRDSNSFKEEMEERRKKFLRETQALAAVTGNNPNSDPISTEGVKIACRKCRSEIGHLSEVYRYMETHFICLNFFADNDLVQIPSDDRETIDAMTDDIALSCNNENCLKPLGKVYKIKITRLLTRKVVKWTIENILFLEGDNIAPKGKNWVEVAKKYSIPNIMQEELLDRIDEMMDCD